MAQLSFHTPVGSLTISEDDGAIIAVDWGWGRDQEWTELLGQAQTQINEYFDGIRRSFDLPIRPTGSRYQLRVWSVLSQIPFGTVSSYSEIAAKSGGVARSVGQASRANPMPILIPCHRVVGAVGVGGYSGDGGVDTKRYLLNIEKAIA